MMLTRYKPGGEAIIECRDIDCIDTLDNKPIRWEGKVAVFTSDQLQEYGEPYRYGYTEYMIVDSVIPHYVADPKFEEDREPQKDKHRYCRIERFRSIFLQLCGVRGKVDEEVLEAIRGYNVNPDPACIYESIRVILKEHKFKKYYNRIGSIIHALGYSYSIVLKNVRYDTIEAQFIRASYRFDQFKDRFDRRYFPNLRYWALKLLNVYGADFQYRIPFIRTKRIEKLLDTIWEDLL